MIRTAIKRTNPIHFLKTKEATDEDYKELFSYTDNEEFLGITNIEGIDYIAAEDPSGTFYIDQNDILYVDDRKTATTISEKYFDRLYKEV